MNLSVQVFIDREDGQRDLFDPPTDAQGRAGFDSWRDTVWGSRQARALGVEYFPRLAEGDLHVEPGEVPGFLRECAALRENLDKLVPGMDALDPHAAGHLVNTGVEVRVESCDAVADFRETVADRLANIEAAAKYALVVGGGVTISTSDAPFADEPDEPGDLDDPEPDPAQMSPNADTEP